MRGLINIVLIFFLSSCQTQTQTEFEKIYSDASKEIDKGNFEQAIKHLNKAILLNYRGDSLYTLKGYCYYQIGDYEKTIKQAEMALSFNSQNDYAYFLKGISKSNMNIYDPIKDKLYSDKFNYDTLDGIFYAPYSISYSSNGMINKVVDLRSAIEDLSKSIELFDSYADSYNERGKLYRQIRVYDRALVDFNKAIELLKDDPEFYHQRALLYKEQKQPEQSLKDFDRAIELEQNPFFYANRGYLKREQLQDEKGACEDLKTAANLGLSLDDDKCK